MVDAIISAVVKNLTSMLLSSIKEEVKLVTGVNDEIKKLVSNFESIQALLDDAEEKQLNKASVKKWLFDLKAVSYDMDDVLDEWKTWIQTSQLQHPHHSSDSDQNHLMHQVLSIFRCNCFTIRDVGLRYVVGGRIKEIHRRLDDIATDKVLYELNSTNISDKAIERHGTTSFVDTQKVKGRNEEKEKVKSMILKSKSKPRVISLVGMGGIGKTTLAKLIYNDGEINTHFEKKIWVCVSDPFDKMRIAKAILESFRYSSTEHNFKELDKVLTEINADLNGKKFLLVLDDIWNESYSKWEELEQFLGCGSPGSTILITTRNERVARVMGCNPEGIHKVGLLTSEECWSIISQIALVQVDCQKLESIGRRIADKCKGLPLVATTIGSLLRFKKSKKEWLRVLEKKEWEDEDILGPLKLSYYDLPLILKQCFSYCAIFPKDSIIEKGILIRMWMAQDYLKGKERDEDLEMVGEIYFDNLVARSLLQISSYDEDCYVLHDMVSDLAQTFTKNECLTREVLKDTESSGNSLHADANVRHLTLTIENGASFPSSIYDLNKLRTLIFQFVMCGSVTVVELERIFDHLTCLRTLYLSGCDIEEIPSSINRLVHLRWLNLSGDFNLEKLPETLCECYNLQDLNLCNCSSMVKLPKNIGKLINLIYLNIDGCDRIKYLPKGVGNLCRLRELTVVIASVNQSESFSIVEMEKLNNLRGRLEIRGLGNVRNLEEARKAQLNKKNSVTELILIFDGHHVPEDEEELLEESLDGDHVPEDEEELIEESFDGDHVLEDEEELLEESLDGDHVPEDEEELLKESLDGDHVPEDEEELLEESFDGDHVREDEEGLLEESFDGDHVREDEEGLLEESFDGDHVQEDEEELLEALEPPSNLEILRIYKFKGKTLFPSWMMKLNLLKKLTIVKSRNCEELPPLGKLLCLEELYLGRMRVKRVGVEFMGIEKEKDASTPFLSFPKLKTLQFDDFHNWEEWDDIDEWLMERINNKTITIMPSLQQLVIHWSLKLKTLPYHLLSPPITTRLQELDIYKCDVLEQEVVKDKLFHIPHLKIA